MEFPRQHVGFPLFTPPLPVPARKHETLSDSPGRKHELALLCDSHHDLQPNPDHMTVLEVPRGEFKYSKNTNVHDSVFVSFSVSFFQGTLTITYCSGVNLATANITNLT